MLGRDVPRRRNIARKARASLGWSLALLGLIHAGLSALVGWGPAEFHDPLYGEKLAQLRGRVSRAEAGTQLVVVLGSSRALTGLNAQLLERRLSEIRRPAVIYNFAVPGGGPVTELLLLHRLLEDGVQPDLLILEMWPAFFAETAVSGNLQWLESHGIGLEERNWLATYGPLADPRSVTTMGGMVVPWYRHRFALLRRFARKLMPSIPWGVRSAWFDEAGWEPIGGERPSQEVYAQLVTADRQAVLPYFQTDRLAPASCRVVKDILTLARQHQIHVVLTLFPEASDLRQWCPDEYRGRMMTALEAASRERDFDLIDGHDWLPDEDFFDPVHVMAAGADNFTDRFAQLMGELDGSTANVASRPADRLR
ncbi:MAG TPA: DUF1574 family protein [Pirellulales bacterium]|jgi:hypothetical protein|nr:DUF1574 family protein [Pirellulales bacterium]